MVKIVWTDLSASDLKEIFDFIAEDSSRYASITVNKIYHRVQPIAKTPTWVEWSLNLSKRPFES
jgi:plasmid stabilization system protein ParE